jgi:hypothetical protein
MNQMTGSWGKGAERHSVLFWLVVLAAFFVAVYFVLMILF